MDSFLLHLKSHIIRYILLLLILWTSLPQFAREYEGYNILFIAFDDLRPEIGAYGVPDPITPNIDRVAAGGTRFDRAYVNYPLCLPSRAAMLTGVRFNNLDLPNGSREFNDMIAVQDTWPRTFNKGGYWTATTGKIYHGNPPNIEQDAWDIAGEKWKTDLDFSSYIMSRVVDEGGRNGQIETFRSTGNGLGLLVYQSIDGPDDLLNDGITANEAVDFIKNLRDPGKPFVICAGFNRPHLPWLAPKKYYDMYPDDVGTVVHNPAGQPEVLKTYDVTAKNSGLWLEGVNDSLARRLIRAYMASTTYADAQLGRILDALEEEELADSTIIVVWGDHGYHLTEHGLWRKNTQYHASMRCPLIIRVPGLTRGEATDRVAQNIDIYPTLLDLTGLTPHLQLHGKSLVPLLINPDTSWTDEAFTCAKQRHGLITDRFRFTDMNEGSFQLFDLDEDPHEWNDLSARPEYRNMVNSFAEKLSDATWNEAKNGNYSYLDEKVSLNQQSLRLSPSESYSFLVGYHSPVNREINLELVDENNMQLGSGRSMAEPGIQNIEIQLECSVLPSAGKVYELRVDIRPTGSPVLEAIDFDTVKIDMLPPATVEFQVRNSSNGNPVPAANLVFGEQVLYTDSKGYTRVEDVSLACYDCELHAFHYDPLFLHNLDIRGDTLIVLHLQPLVYKLTLHVSEYISKAALPFTSIQLGEKILRTDILGRIELDQEYGSYPLHITIPNFEDFQTVVHVASDTSILLMPVRAGANVDFRVYHKLKRMEGARIQIGDRQEVTDSDGMVSFQGLAVDSALEYYVSSESFHIFTDTLTLTGDSLVIVRLISLALDQYGSLPVFRVYPNPADDFLVISYARSTGPIRLLDVCGRPCMLIRDITDRQVLTVSHLLPGIYYLRDPNGTTVKIVKL